MLPISKGKLYIFINPLHLYCILMSIWTWNSEVFLSDFRENNFYLLDSCMHFKRAPHFCSEPQNMINLKYLYMLIFLLLFSGCLLSGWYSLLSTWVQLWSRTRTMFEKWTFWFYSWYCISIWYKITLSIKTTTWQL